MPGQLVSIQIVEPDDIDRLVHLFDLDLTDVFQATFSASCGKTGSQHKAAAAEALRHVARRKKDGLDATVIYLACAEPGDMAVTYRWARHLFVRCLTNKDSVSLIQTTNK